MEVEEVKLKKTPDVHGLPRLNKIKEKLSWRKWMVFPRWDLANIELDEKEDKQKVIDKLKDNFISQSTYSGKHHITYWKHYNSPEDYEKEYPDKPKE